MMQRLDLLQKKGARRMPCEEQFGFPEQSDLPCLLASRPSSRPGPLSLHSSNPTSWRPLHRWACLNSLSSLESQGRLLAALALLLHGRQLCYVLLDLFPDQICPFDLNLRRLSARVLMTVPQGQA